MPVAIVNEAFARRYWPGRSALGKRLREFGGDSWRVVVGVVADIKHAGPAAEARPEVDLPYAQLDPDFLTRWSRGITLAMAGGLPASALAPIARGRLAALDPTMPMTNVQSVASQLTSMKRWLKRAYRHHAQSRELKRQRDLSVRFAAFARFARLTRRNVQNAVTQRTP